MGAVTLSARGLSRAVTEVTARLEAREPVVAGLEAPLELFRLWQAGVAIVSESIAQRVGRWQKRSAPHAVRDWG